jgi:hypothetical protein
VPELETMLTRIWNPEIRPLAEEAWRSYNAGAVRAAIASTWTAVTADVIGKIVHVADDGEAGAVAFRGEFEAAQARGLTPVGVRAMEAIEDKLLATAVAFELTDSTSGSSSGSGRTAICASTPPCAASARCTSRVRRPPRAPRERPGHAADVPAHPGQ